MCLVGVGGFGVWCLTCGDGMSLGWLFGVCGAPAFLGAGGVFGLGGVGEWCRVVRGCYEARFLGVLNVVVCQWISVFGWCWVGFVGCARRCFRQRRMLLRW